jgi:DNA-binding MarR family transcriptional regulator
MAQLNLVDGLFQLSFRLHDMLARIAAEHDLSVAQVRLLGILRDREPSVLELARHLDLEKSSMSGLLDRAEKRGLVERVASKADARSTKVRVTAQGRKLSRVVEEKVTAEVAKLTVSLSKTERAELAAMLTRLMVGSDG